MNGKNTMDRKDAELRDGELCLEAVRNNGAALEYVPEELRDA